MSSRSEADGQAWCVELSLAGPGEGEDSFAVFEAALEDPAGPGTVSRFRDQAGGGWTLRALCASRPDEAALRLRLAVAEAATGREVASLSLAPLPATDWVAEVNRKTPPIRVGRFFVRGSHVRGPSPRGTLEILLDAGRAFGTGTHESTRGCLLALDREPPPRGDAILDLGTGSGILAIAAAKRWKRPVLAADIDPVSVATAGENAALNGVDDLIETRRSLGFANPRLRIRAPYGLILANILAVPLIRLAPAIARYLRRDGRVVLSGLLSEQASAVATAYARVGLAVRDRHPVDGWTTLVAGRR